MILKRALRIGSVSAWLSLAGAGVALAGTCNGDDDRFNGDVETKGIVIIGAEIAADPEKYSRNRIALDGKNYFHLGSGYLAFKDSQFGYVVTAAHVVNLACSGTLNGISKEVKVILPKTDKVAVAAASLVNPPGDICSPNLRIETETKDVALLKVKLSDLARFPDAELKVLPTSLKVVVGQPAFTYSAAGYMPGSVQRYPTNFAAIQPYVANNAVVPGVWIIGIDATFGFSGSPVIARVGESYSVVGILTKLFRDQQEIEKETAEIRTNAPPVSLTLSQLVAAIHSTAQQGSHKYGKARFAGLSALGQLLPDKQSSPVVNQILSLLIEPATHENLALLEAFVGQLKAWEQAILMKELDRILKAKSPKISIEYLMDLHIHEEEWCWSEKRIRREIIARTAELTQSPAGRQRFVEHGQAVMKTAWGARSNNSLDATVNALEFAAYATSLGREGLPLSSVYVTDEAIARIRLAEVTKSEVKRRDALDVSRVAEEANPKNTGLLKSAGDFKLNTAKQSNSVEHRQLLFEEAMTNYLQSWEAASSQSMKASVAKSFQHGVEIGRLSNFEPASMWVLKGRAAGIPIR